MKAVIQRVSQSVVKVNGETVGEIGVGYMLLLGIEAEDSRTDIDWLVKKVINMRLFTDDEGKMNHSILDVKGSMLVISQFTLCASTKKGNRPSYMKAARPNIAIPLYEEFCDQLRVESRLEVQTGLFGGDMKVSLINDGPVTILLDSKTKG